MSTKITLTYNPYTHAVALEGGEGSRMTPRLAEFLRGPMEDWLDYRTVSYRCWNGLLPELMQELNDDALEITFEGAPEDFQRLEKGLRSQCEAIGEYGYEPEAWTLGFKPRFDPETILSRMRVIADENEAFRSPNQDVAQKRVRRRRELDSCPLTVAAVEKARQKWLSLFELAAAGAESEAVRDAWLSEKDRMNQVFER